MVKPACFDRNGMKKGAWSEEEDNRLRFYVENYGHWNWRLLPKYAGLARCGKSCRLRWVNYLKPGVKREKFSKQEENLIIKLHQELGNKWSAMAEKLPGRTDNDIKNYWHAHIHKRIKRESNKSSTKKSSIAQSSDEGSVNTVDDISGSTTHDHSDSSETESFWNDPALADLSNGGIENYVPTFTTLGEHHTEYYPSTLEGNVADIIPSDSLPQAVFEQGSIWDASYYFETDFRDVIYSAHLAAQEEERPFDLFQDFGIV